MTAVRLTCAVLGCRRTRGRHKGEAPIKPGEEWVCGAHWRQVPASMRAILARTRRKARRTGDWGPPWRIWLRCKRAAIERSVGL